MAGREQVTVYFFTWYESDSGRHVQAPRAATLTAIEAACGSPLLDTAHRVAVSELNELGFVKRPSRNCESCGRQLIYLGAWLDDHVSRPRRDQAFGCPDGHEQWRYLAPRQTWQLDASHASDSDEPSASLSA